jgi:hypothetical protein
LTKAPLSWNGSEFIFNNSAGDSPYTIRFKPASTGYIDFGGNEEGTRLFFGFDPAVFQVDVSHTEEPFTSYFYITGDAASLNAKNIGIGDDNGLLNSLLFRVNNITKQFVFTGDPAATTSVAFQRINQFYFSVDLKSIAICGNVTSNAAVGTVNICDGSSSATVTNPTVTANSIIFPVMRTNDATCTVKSVVPSAGSFIVTMNANCTAKTSIGWFVVNSAS